MTLCWACFLADDRSRCRKEITFVNTKNKSNDQFVSVRANNIDPLRITFHSVFYHLITPYSHNYLDFENVIVGSPAVPLLSFVLSFVRSFSFGFVV